MTITDKINICLSVTTVIVSVVAIAISINTSKKQNKISLFEKRMEVYSVVLKLITIGQQMRIAQLSNKNYDVSSFFQTIGYVFSEGQNYSINKRDYDRIFFYVSHIIDSSTFLFDESVSEKLQKISSLLSEIESNHKDEDIMVKVSEFSSLVINFSCEDLENMKRSLKL